VSEQLSFMEMKPEKRTDRLFLGTFLDPGTAAGVVQLSHRLRDDYGLRGKSLAADRLHVTLNHLGDHAGVPQSVVAAAREAAAALSESSFEVTFDRVMSFRTRGLKQPFVLSGEGEGIAAMMAFQQSLAMAMRKAGLGRWVGTRFKPHMTLLYDDRLVGEQIVEPISWTVREFVLVHSLLRQTRHIPLGRWPLRG
jgi:RNA 2',3'-cyclic 3'-phosphodiesterase